MAGCPKRTHQQKRTLYSASYYTPIRGRLP